MAVAMKEMEFVEGEQAKVCAVEGCGAKFWCKGYCRKHYASFQYHGDPTITKMKPKDPIERFKTYYKEDGDGCWEWNAIGPGKLRYGKFTLNNKTVSAHRFSYEYYKGPIPEGMVIMHLCDNSRCVQPKHLRVGTIGDNVRDCVNKGRNPISKKGVLPEAFKNRPWRNNYQTTLNEEKVSEIKRRIKDGESRLKIMTEFDISKSVFSGIKNNRTWRHVP